MDSNILEFYAGGGLFMHLITILAAAAGFYTVKSAAILKWGERNHGNELFCASIALATRLTTACVAVSVLGTFLGCREVFQIIGQVPADEYAAALTKGLGLAFTTVGWAMMVAIPTFLAGTIVRYRYAIKCMTPPGQSRS